MLREHMDYIVVYATAVVIGLIVSLMVIFIFDSKARTIDMVRFKEIVILILFSSIITKGITEFLHLKK